MPLPYLAVSKERDRKMLPHEAVKIPTCTKKFPLTRAQPDNFLRQRNFIYKPLKKHFFAFHSRTAMPMSYL